MAKHGVLIFPLLTALVLAGCRLDSEGASGQPLSFATVEQSHRSGIMDARQAVVKDVSAWLSLWEAHTRHVTPPPEVPRVDFSRQMVLGVFLGQRPNLCHQVTIEAVESSARHKLLVRYRETGSRPGSLCAQAIAYPVHLVSVDRSSLPVEFLASNWHNPNRRWIMPQKRPFRVPLAPVGR